MNLNSTFQSVEDDEKGEININKEEDEEEKIDWLTDWLANISIPLL